MILYNPHVSCLLGELPYYKLRGRHSSKKYSFLIEEAVRRNETIKIEIDFTTSSIFPCKLFSKTPLILRKVIGYIEYWLWVRLNKITNNVVLVDQINTNFEKESIVVFLYKNLSCIDFKNECDLTINKYGRVVIHCTHYFMDISTKSKFISKYKNVLFCADSNLENNPLFNHYFDVGNEGFKVLPFAVSDRFKLKVDHTPRLKKAIATGTLIDLRLENHNCAHNDFSLFFNTNYYHPIRAEIYNNSHCIDDKVFSVISPFRKQSNGLFSKITSILSISQHDYFAINLVDLYNRYTFVIVGEEITGAPALGAFEAMACGAILIGDPRYYNGLGLIEFLHYIPHAGNLNSILEVIDKFSYDEKRLNQIREHSLRFINGMRSNNVYDKWICEIDEYQT